MSAMRAQLRLEIRKLMVIVVEGGCLWSGDQVLSWIGVYTTYDYRGEV